MEIGLKARTAQLYMKLADLFARHGEDVYLVPLAAAENLASPSVDEAIVIEMLMRARSGERLTCKFVTERICLAKGNVGERAPERAAEMSAVVVATLDVPKKAGLARFLGVKPGAHDRQFMKNLRERLAADLRNVPRLPLRRIPAA